MLNALAVAAALAWVALLLVPWQPWRNLHLLSARPAPCAPLDDVSILIPARDEATLLPGTLRAAMQDESVEIVVVDDGSMDGTASVARDAAARAGCVHLVVVEGTPLPPGWSGKLWAQAQGMARISRPLVLLLDADIELAPGMIAALRQKLVEDRLDLVSVMASLRMHSVWEKLLIPPFIYFFKLIYPFALSNRHGHRVACAAGGCILLRRSGLEAAGGVEAFKDALIDDCTLAATLKREGGRLWTGQSLDVRSTRAYEGLGPIWRMVARTAFTQLGHSLALLLLTTVAMAVMFVVPVVACFTASAPWGLVALAAMFVSFTPCILFYGLGPGWILSLPAAASLFMLMTWDSALRWWRGEQARWKGRQYPSRSP